MLLTSPAVGGEFGHTGAIAGDLSEQEVENRLRSAVKSFRSKLDGIDDYSQFILTIAQTIEPYWQVDIDLPKEYEESAVPKWVFLQIDVARPLLQQADEIAEREFEEAMVGFAEDLQDQGELDNAVETVVEYFLEFDEEIVFYLNSMTTQLENGLLEISETSEYSAKKLVNLYLEAAIYYERSLPITLAVVYRLTNQDFEWDAIKSENLSNLVATVQGFHPLAVFVEEFDSNIRNALAHGGPDASYRVNQPEATITFRYRVGEDRESETMSLAEFERTTLAVYGAATSLVILPTFLLVVHTYFQMIEEVGLIEE